MPGGAYMVSTLNGSPAYSRTRTRKVKEESMTQANEDPQVIEQIVNAVLKAISEKPDNIWDLIIRADPLNMSIYRLYHHAKQVYEELKDLPLFVGLELKQGDFHFSISKQTPIEGINSNIKGTKKHVLFWDFDNVPLEEVIKTLCKIQRKYHLPRISVVNTGVEGYFHAYCFKAKKWGDAIKIIAETEGVDRMFFWLGIMRGYFTLRIGDKPGRSFQAIAILPSKYIPDVHPNDLENTIIYQTGKA
jgi:hypothetical protein